MFNELDLDDKSLEMGIEGVPVDQPDRTTSSTGACGCYFKHMISEVDMRT
jgi:hypothetical protein